jgi:MYXO-CTERM domain-containing protein
MFPFDPLDFLMNCDCSIGQAAGGGRHILPAAMLLCLAFALTLYRRRPRG